MRISTALIALAAATSPACCLSINTDSQARLSPSVDSDDGYKIPGDSPLELCRSDHTLDMIEIQRVDLLPNPPEAGKNLTISAMGVVKETICEGAYMNVQVKYGLIKLISTQADMCEQIRNVDMECPVEAGFVKLNKIVELPAEIPPVCCNSEFSSALLSHFLRTDTPPQLLVKAF